MMDFINYPHKIIFLHPFPFEFSENFNFCINPFVLDALAGLFLKRASIFKIEKNHDNWSYLWKKRSFSH